MSPRAACRLETLGFDHVFDYVPGKADWLARGLPREGDRAAERRASDAVQRDVVTCQLAERVGDVRRRMEASPYRFAFVLAKDRTLLGRLRRSTSKDDGNATAEEVMEPGPSTVRADLPLDRLRELLDRRGLRTAVVTTPDGVLIGVVRRTGLG